MALAVVTTAKKLKYYFQSHNVVVRTNQPLRKANQRPETSGRLVHWSIQLSEHDIRYEPRPTLKAQALADLAEITPGEAEQPKPELIWELHVDGASNEKGAGAGAILKGPWKVKIEYGANIQFAASNNVAEYEALITGLGLALEIRTEILKIYSDSHLVVNQVKGEYQAKEAGMIKYLEKVMKQLRQLEAQGGQWEIIQIPREKNTDADAIAKSASELGDLFTKMQLKETLRLPNTKEEEVMAIDEVDSWMTPLIKYLDRGELPTDNVEAIRVIRKSANYSYHNGFLYRTSLTHPWSRCVSPQTGGSILKEIHEGICGANKGAITIARKTMLQNYYWPTIKEDAKTLVKKYDKCQRHDNVSCRPAASQGSLESPWPFAIWGIDIVGPFETGKHQMKFLIVAIEHFTKWVEVAPVATITAARVEEFFKNEVICRFSIPHTVIADNGKQFDCKRFKEFCKELMINLKFTSVAHLQTNGMTEVTNRTIAQGIKKRLDQYKDNWAQELYSVLWAYRTTQRKGTRETPFRLAYGIEAVIPIEIGVPSIRVNYLEEETNEARIRLCLDLLEERRNEATIRAATYKKQAA
ncbi:uncharacterized protein LOC126678290 [Mercurialis annua]|uniref:uncharacterized protein LOC126678290 n=1 Tax=Mercurialis annua TaxID=3986 RepID=UPI0021606EDC|nr:uncharacterized protein LOC126678290 [Mercurialis annua]